MKHKINVFLYICKGTKIENYEKETKKGIIERTPNSGKNRKFVATKKKRCKGVTIKYLSFDKKRKRYFEKKSWNINYILNQIKQKKEKEKKKGKGKGKEETNLRNETKIITNEKLVNRNEKINKKNEWSTNNTSNKLNKDKTWLETDSKSYLSLINNIKKNLENYNDTTLINIGVETRREEKNIFLFGDVFKGYLKKWRRKRKKSEGFVKCLKNSETKYEYFKEKVKSKEENIVLNKTGIIIDLYEYIIKGMSEEATIYISVWVYLNSKLVDLLKKRKREKHFSEKENDTFCQKCYLNYCLDKRKNEKESSCKNYPRNKVIKNDKIFQKNYKYIIKEYTRLLSRKKKNTNLCFVFKYKIRINEKSLFIFLINFPFSFINKNQIFENNNNEKCLLYFFNKKILKTLNSVTNLSTFLFPIFEFKKCQAISYVKEKALYFLTHGMYSIVDDVKKNRKSSLKQKGVVKEKKENNACFDTTNIKKKKELKKKNNVPTKNGDKKKWSFHFNVCELLIRLLFQNSRTYFSVFIHETVGVDNYQENIYYLNMCKLVNVMVRLKPLKKKKRNKKHTKEQLKKDTQNTILSDNKECRLIDLLRENDQHKYKIEDQKKQIVKFEKEINVKDEMITNIKKEIKDKEDIISNYMNEIKMFKNEISEKITIIENLKKKYAAAKCEKPKNEIVEEPIQKNSTYVQKLYNENNLLKEKIKKLSDVAKTDKIDLKSPEKGNLTKTFTNNKNLGDVQIKGEKTENSKLQFFFNAFEETEQKLYIADFVIKAQKEIIETIKKREREHLDELQSKQIAFKKEIDNSFDFIYSVCDDIQSKSEKICLINRINNMKRCIKNFLSNFEKD